MKKLLTLLMLPAGFLLWSQVGIGIVSPDPSAMLHVSASDKGFLPPRVSLQNLTDNITIPSPAKGLLVYNISNNLSGEGIYINRGTPTNPIWSVLEAGDPTSGSTVKKIIYTGTAPDPNQEVINGDLKFRMSPVFNGGIPEVALTSPQNKTLYVGNNQIYAVNGYTYQDIVKNYTVADYDVYQWVGNNSSDAIADAELNVIHIVDPQTNSYYRVTYYISGVGTKAYIIIAEKF